MLMQKIKKMFCDKYIFLKVYIIASIIIIIYRLMFAIIDEEVILDNLNVNIKNHIFGSLFYVKYYLAVSFDSVGPVAILLILHFGLLIEEKIVDITRDMRMYIIILIPVFGIFFYYVFRIKMDCVLPFSLFEAILFSCILYPIDKVLKIRDKIYAYKNK